MRGELVSDLFELVACIERATAGENRDSLACVEDVGGAIELGCGRDGRLPSKNLRGVMGDVALGAI